MKQEYTAPQAEKLEFDYQNTVTASDIIEYHGDMGHGIGGGGGCDREPGHGNPKTPHPVFGNS